MSERFQLVIFIIFNLIRSENKTSKTQFFNKISQLIVGRPSYRPDHCGWALGNGHQGVSEKHFFQENQKYNPPHISLGVSLKGSMRILYSYKFSSASSPSLLPIFTLQIFTRPSHDRAERRLSENLQCKNGQNRSGWRHPLTLLKSKDILDPFKLAPRVIRNRLYF